MNNTIWGFKGLEQKYGIKVVSEGYHYSPFIGKCVETFKIYTADECLWEKGLLRRYVKYECIEWEEALLSIKNSIKEA